MSPWVNQGQQGHLLIFPFKLLGNFIGNRGAYTKSPDQIRPLWLYMFYYSKVKRSDFFYACRV